MCTRVLGAATRAETHHNAVSHDGERRHAGTAQRGRNQQALEQDVGAALERAASRETFSGANT